MPKDFINSNRLVTLPELQYLLLEVLDRQEPMPGIELSRICKKRSLNFSFAFENTLIFLELISVIKINTDQSVTRSSEENFDLLETEQDLSTFIIKKTISYLEAKQLTRYIITNDTVKKDASENYTFYTDKTAGEFPFIKVLLLNFKIAVASQKSNDQLIIAEQYKLFFKPIDTTTIDPPPPPKPQPLPPISTSPPKPVNFFISYSHKDEVFNDELKNHFAGLKNQGLITGWDGREISPGQDWDDEIRKKLEKADIILFLVSSDFMASEYIRDVEIHKAIERHNSGHVKIIPVLLRSCDYRSLPIARLQVVPRGARPINNWEDKDAAYLNVVEQIRNILIQKSNNLIQS